MTKSIKIFYSWQSDLDPKITSGVIRGEIRTAINNIEDSNHIYKLDESTQNLPGSPNIPLSILSKIQSSDIFICDVTIINHEIETGRKVPNPNVLIELGYAISCLGWPRIIMVFNESLGKVEDLPFDIDRYRVSKFKLTDKLDKNNRAILRDNLIDNIKLIVNQNPIKNIIINQSNENKKRERDIKSIKEIFNDVSLSGIDRLIFDLPLRIDNESSAIFNYINSIFRKTSFHLYDREAYHMVFTFHKSLNEIFSSFNLFSEYMNGYSEFRMPRPLSPHLIRARETYKKNEKLKGELKLSFKHLISYIKDNYLEVELLD